MSLKLTRLPAWSVNTQHPAVAVPTRRSKRRSSQGGGDPQDQGVTNIDSDSLPSPRRRNKSQVKNTNTLAICVNATSLVIGMGLSQDSALPTSSTSHHPFEEEAMLFKLHYVQRVLATGTSGHVYLARYASLHIQNAVQPLLLLVTCQFCGYLMHSSIELDVARIHV